MSANPDPATLATSENPTSLPADDSHMLELDTNVEDQESNNLTDSVFGSSVRGSETPNLDSEILKYRVENGRTYHSYGSTEHWEPNDEQAKDQQDWSHHFWTLVLAGDLYSTPIKAPQVWIIEG